MLVTEIEHAAPKEEFLSMLDRPAGNHIFDVFNLVEPQHPEFCLFLSTSLPARLLLDGRILHAMNVTKQIFFAVKQEVINRSY